MPPVAGPVAAHIVHVTDQETRARVGTIGCILSVKSRGTPPAGTRVQLLKSDRSPFAMAFTDVAGSFEFRGIPSGNYFIVIDSPNYRRVDIGVEVPRGGAQRRTIFLEPLSEVSLPAGAVVSAGAFSVPAEAGKLFAKGESELQKGHYPEAGRYFDRALSIEPRFAEALSGRGLIFLQDNDLERARQHFERALALRPGLAQALFGLGTICSRLDNYEEAIEYYTRGLSIDPGSLAASFERARCYFELRQFERAERDCIRARQLSPEPRPALNVLLGNIYLGEGRESEALGEFEEFLRLDSHNPVAPQARALVRKLRHTGFKPPR